MNIVSKTFTTLPADICNIIYQYYKPQYLVDIENIDKYSLLKNWFNSYGVDDEVFYDNDGNPIGDEVNSIRLDKLRDWMMPRLGQFFPRNTPTIWAETICQMNNTLLPHTRAKLGMCGLNSHLHLNADDDEYYYYVDRFFQQTRVDVSFQKNFIELRHDRCYGNEYIRDDIKLWCKQNGIAFQPRTHTKTMIKKLMKL